MWSLRSFPFQTLHHSPDTLFLWFRFSALLVGGNLLHDFVAGDCLRKLYHKNDMLVQKLNVLLLNGLVARQVL